MQVKLEVITDKSGASYTAVELSRIQEYILQLTTGIMRSFGIAKVQLKVDGAGVFPVCVPTFVPLMDDVIPPAIKVARTDIVRGVVRTIMERFGLQLLELSLDANEVAELKQFWAQASGGGGDTKYAGLKIPTDVDPQAPPAIAVVDAPPENAPVDDEPTALANSGINEQRQRAELLAESGANDATKPA